LFAFSLPLGEVKANPPVSPLSRGEGKRQEAREIEDFFLILNSAM